MRYLGGKTNLARDLITVISSLASGRSNYLEPFVGGGSVLVEAVRHFENCAAGDIHEDLVLLWRALQAGWEPPSSITIDDYNRLRDVQSSPLRGFVGFPCSFGGKWFGGLARGGYRADGQPRNHVDEARRACLAKAKMVQDVYFDCRSYDQWEVDDSVVVYCDIPYHGTTSYGSSFDHTLFWSWARRMTNECGAVVFVSELAAPDDFEVVWSKTRKVGSTVSVSGRGNSGSVVDDKLFVLRGAL